MRSKSFFFAFLFALGLAGCASESKKSSSSSGRVVPGTVTILVDSQQTLSLTGARSVLLTWSTSNVIESSCSIRGSDGSSFSYSSLNAQVTPTSTVAYTLSCLNKDNKTYASSTASVMFSNGSTLPASVSIVANGQTLLNLTASQLITLSWSATNVQESTCSVIGTDGSTQSYFNRSAAVTPTAATTTYTISCQDINNATVRSSATVVVANGSAAGGGIMSTILELLPSLIGNLLQ